MKNLKLNVMKKDSKLKNGINSSNNKYYLLINSNNNLLWDQKKKFNN